MLETGCQVYLQPDREGASPTEQGRHFLPGCQNPANVRASLELEVLRFGKCSGLGVWARGMCCTSPFPRRSLGPGTQPGLVLSGDHHSPHCLCFFITPRKHYLRYFCGGDIIVWLCRQTFAWIWGSKGGRWDPRGAGWSSRGETCCWGRVGQQGERLPFFGDFRR